MEKKRFYWWSSKTIKRVMVLRLTVGTCRIRGDRFLLILEKKNY
jgi:hypothetical protein